MRDEVFLVLVHLRVRLALVLEDGVPACVRLAPTLPCAKTSTGKKGIEKAELTKITRPPCRHNLAIRDPLKENRLMPRSRRVRKRAHGLGRLVLVRREQVVEPGVADGFEEPFAR